MIYTGNKKTNDVFNLHNGFHFTASSLLFRSFFLFLVISFTRQFITTWPQCMFGS